MILNMCTLLVLWIGLIKLSGTVNINLGSCCFLTWPPFFKWQPDFLTQVIRRISMFFFCMAIYSLQVSNFKNSVKNPFNRIIGS